MADSIYITDIKGALKTNPQAFNLKNDSFPTMQNMYQWRGTVKRKRGTAPLARLQVFLPYIITTPPGTIAPGLPAPTGGEAYSGNLLTMYPAFPFSGEPGSQIGSIAIYFDYGLANQTLYEDDGNGNLFKVSGPFGFASGTINYVTGAFTIHFGASGRPGALVPVRANMGYYPSLPVMGLEDYVINTQEGQFPLLLAFDTTYSYQVNQSGGFPFFYNTNFYKKSNVEFYWSAPDYQQFWSTNYQSAFWATNNKPGLNLLTGTYVSGSATNIITFTFLTPTYFNPPATAFTTLVIGDQLWFNEWPTVASPLININGLVGTVTGIAGAASGTYEVTFTVAPTVSGTGIVQMLTNTLPGQDGIKWYDGDPTGGTGLPAGNVYGWVNFAPPLTAFNVSINDQIAQKYYLVGALAILPFKDRLLFFSPIIQTSGGQPIQIPLQDTVLWSWNGTPYYNSFVPTNVGYNQTSSETFDIRAYYVDQTGFGGYLPAGISQPIVTILNNEDVLLIGFGGAGKKTRFVYTGNDLQPFIFYLINSELPSNSTFSGVVLDRGAIEMGAYGITITTQQNCARIDPDIPDEIFKVSASNNGQMRVNAIRDFFRQWIYFTYPVGNGSNSSGSWVYPTQTLLFNYIDTTWAIFEENFTRHGTFRMFTDYTWETLPYASWDAWSEPWNSGSSTAQFPDIIAGTPQGYVVKKGEGTSEAPTRSVFAIANDGLGNTQITSYNHCFNLDQYAYFTGLRGATYINGLVGRVITTPNANTFVVDIPYVTSTYTGAGQITQLSQPILQTKQFNPYWQEGRGVRLGVQKFLLDVTANGQITIGIGLSQDNVNSWNDGPIVPAEDVLNPAIVYTETLLTCPESYQSPATNISQANSSLQALVGQSQRQMWHRGNTSLQGDSFQVNMTLSDAQMRNVEYATSEISLSSIQLTVYRGPLLS